MPATVCWLLMAQWKPKLGRGLDIAGLDQWLWTWSKWTTGGPSEISSGPQRVPGLRLNMPFESTDFSAIQLWMLMRCQHRQVVHRIFFQKMVHEPKKVENHWSRCNIGNIHVDMLGMLWIVHSLRSFRDFPRNCDALIRKETGTGALAINEFEFDTASSEVRCYFTILILVSCQVTDTSYSLTGIHWLDFYNTWSWSLSTFIKVPIKIT